MDKAAVTAFDREKRVYKDAYVDNFRKVRYFPALASLGAAGHAQGASIVLVQESQAACGDVDKARRRKQRPVDSVPSRLIPADSLDEIFDSTLPLASFRSAILCKHTKARAERASNSPTRSKDSVGPTTERYGAAPSATFKPSSAVEAKTAIERKVTYDGQEFRDPSYRARKFTPRAGGPEWLYNNPTEAREELHGKVYLHEPPDGAIKADRKYTQEFIRMSMEAYQASQQQQQQQQQ